MTVQIFIALLFALPIANSSPVFRWPFYQYYYQQPIYGAPVFRFSSMSSPLGHVDGSSAITGKASTYQNVLFQPKPEQYQPRFFRRYKSCTDGGGLDVKGYFIEFDLNRDGRVSFSEVNAVSLCNLNTITGEPMTNTLESNCAPFIDVASTTMKVLEKIIPRHMFQFFQSMDENNDQNLDINEFFNFAQELANANDFYEKALLDASGDDEVITQNEWECTKDQITNNECDTTQFSPDRTLIENMIGNNGDSQLTFTEFKNVMEFYEGVAKESFNLDLLCNSVEPDNKAVFKRADGTWDQWTDWACPACPTVGKKMRTRTCSGSMYSPPICPGFVGDKETDNEADCLIDRCIDGTWTAWSSWSCPTPCFTTPVAKQTRTRTCSGTLCADPQITEETGTDDCTKEICCTTMAGGKHTDLGNGYCKNPANIGGSHSKAKAACEAIGATLAQLKTTNDQADLKAATEATFFRTHGAWWLGIEKDSSGKWKTLGGDDIVNTNWAAGQPNGGNCAYALSTGTALDSDESKTTDTDYKWYDIDCSKGTATNGVCQFQS